MLDRLDWTGRLRLSGDRDAALDGADFILFQLRVGGQAARLIDETLPLQFGAIGEETTGAGGFAKAMRNVPVILELAELAARRAAPNACIVDFRNRSASSPRHSWTTAIGPSAVQRGHHPAVFSGRVRRRTRARGAGAASGSIT